MSTTEILAELPRLTPSDRQEIRARLDELEQPEAGAWLDPGLTIAEKALLDARLDAYHRDPDAGSSWEEVEARVLAQLRK